MPKLRFTKIAKEDLEILQTNHAKKKVLKAVYKTLAFMQENLRHPSLNAHEFRRLKGPNGEKVFEVYAQQNTPGAYRILWYYGPEKGIISIIGIVPHP